MKESTWIPEPYDVPLVPGAEGWDKEKGEEQTRKAESPFEGKIIYLMPLYTQRLKYLKECNFKSEADIKGGSSNYDSMIKMVDIAKKHIKSIDLKIKESGDEIKTMDALEVYEEGGDVLNQVATSILRGVKLGKN